MGSVTRSEWRWVIVFAAIASLLLVIPYLIAYSAQGEAWRFSGFLFGVEDGNSYIADMRQGAEGAWLFRIPYTSEAQSGALIYLPYLLLGKLAGGSAMHEQLVALFHLARIAAGIAMLLAVYRFLACFIESVTLRRWGLVAAAFGGGFGWILLAKPAYPLEFTSPEAFGFLSLFGIPHLAAARALLLLALAWFLSPAESQRHQGIKIGLALIGVWLFQPLTVAVAWAVMAAGIVLQFIRNKSRKGTANLSQRDLLIRAFTAFLLSAPPMIYFALSFALDPVLGQWGAQNTLPSPPIGEYLLSYAVLIVPALGGAILALREDERWSLPIGWMLMVPVLMYLPVSVQRRLVEGFWMALIVLALFLVERLSRVWVRRAAFVFGMALLLPAAVLFWGWTLSNALVPSGPAFLPAEEVRVLEWLDANIEPGTVVLSRHAVGNALPAYADLISFIGHGPETLQYPLKQTLVETVLNPDQADAGRLAALRRTGARYVLVGPTEQGITAGGIPGCELMYRQDGWEIWRVIPSAI